MSGQWPNPTVPRPVGSGVSSTNYSTVTTATQRNCSQVGGVWRFVLKLAGLAPAKRTMMSHPTFAAARRCQAPATARVGGGLVLLIPIPAQCYKNQRGYTVADSCFFLAGRAAGETPFSFISRHGLVALAITAYGGPVRSGLAVPRLRRERR